MPLGSILISCENFLAYAAPLSDWAPVIRLWRRGQLGWSGVGQDQPAQVDSPIAPLTGVLSRLEPEHSAPPDSWRRDQVGPAARLHHEVI